MKILTTIYLGLEDSQFKKQIVKTSDAIEFIQRTFDACTISKCVGSYQYNDGDFASEVTLKIELLDVSMDLVIATVKLLKDVFNQESVLVTNQVLDEARFI